MVKLKKIKLNDQVDCELREREMYMLRGGDGENSDCCTCGCAYSESGGSSSKDNANANIEKGLSSDSGNIQCFLGGVPTADFKLWE